MKILTAQQMRDWDEYTIREEPVSSLDLMERAAATCARWLKDNGLLRSEIIIVCGKGNNGGDGLAIARMITSPDTNVTVYILEFGHLGTEDFQANLARLHGCPDVDIKFVQDNSHFPKIATEQVVIDALYGSGLNRPLDGLSGELVRHINQSKALVISIDLPSGMAADGILTGEAIEATHTLTFQTWKPSLLSADNGAYTGKVHVLDIGLHPGFCDTLPVTDTVIDHSLAGQVYRKRKRFAHKGSFGHSLIVAGSYGKMGAAVLAARSCLHSGTGLLSVHIPSSGYVIMQTAVPEAMVLTDENSSSFTSDVADLSRYSCIGVGPGLGTEKMTRLAVEKLITGSSRPMVIDADALNILAVMPSLMSAIPAGSILTPHPKEFERLFGKTDNSVEQQALAREKARELGVVIVLKGHHSMIAVPGEHRNSTGFFNATGNPGMATGGSGDVLTGILTALISQGYAPADAAIVGVYLHGLAGDLAAEALSEESLSAGDIIDFMPPAFQHLRNIIS